MNTCKGIVQAISEKEVKGRNGKTYKVYSYRIDDDWYNVGFSSPASKGDEVEFDYDENQYGKQIIKGTKITILSSGNTPPRLKGGSGGNKTGSGKGVFPVPADDGQRSIIRQNAVTNANHLIALYVSQNSDTLPDDLMKGADMLISVARYIEQYTTGDSDKEAAVQKAMKIAKERAWQEAAAAGNAEADDIEDYAKD